MRSYFYGAVIDMRGLRALDRPRGDILIGQGLRGGPNTVFINDLYGVRPGRGAASLYVYTSPPDRRGARVHQGKHGMPPAYFLVLLRGRGDLRGVGVLLRSVACRRDRGGVHGSHRPRRQKRRVESCLASGRSGPHRLIES